MTIQETEQLRNKLQESFELLIKKIGMIQIGSKKQFPYGWRNAAKGRTVWRIIEEIITQNLESSCTEFKLTEVKPSVSEVSVHDLVCKVTGENTPLYINIKSAVLNGRTNKDDLSKAKGLKEFYDSDINKQFFIATFFIKFEDNMTIKINSVTVFPIAWIPDIYVNPSNNGNLQSSKYKKIKDATKRTNQDFFSLFQREIEVANKKKKNPKVKKTKP